jgi:hypothetical protein
MGVRILEGKKINDGPNAGTAAVLYCSTSGVALPMMFESSEKAQRFLDWFGYEKPLGHTDPRRMDDDDLYTAHQQWVEAGKPGGSSLSDEDIESLLDD